MQTSNQFPEEPEEKKAENVVEQASSPLYEFSTPEEDVSHQGLIYPPPPSFYQQAQFSPGQPLPQASMPMYAGTQPAGYPPQGQGEYARMQPPPFIPVPPMQPPPKKSYRWLWITISILVVLLLAGCGLCGWAFSQFFMPIVQSETNAINVTNEYYDALHSNDYASAYQYLKPQGSIAGMTLATFTQRAQNADRQYGAVRSYTTGAVNVITDSNAGLDFSRFTIVVNVTRPSQRYSVLLTLQKSGNDWKITDFDRV